MNDTAGNGVVAKKVVCMHEQDDGILWKHTNYRNGRAVVVRNRRLVVQFVITLANYDYVFAYLLDMAGAITVETRATGIVSTVPIDPAKTSPWGNVVSPGVLAQNHQHLFNLRIDPAIDGQRNTVLQEESLPLPISPDSNPYGNGYEVRQTPLRTSCGVDAAPMRGRVFKMVNPRVRNPVSGRPVGYKLVPSPTQLTLAHPDSTMARRVAYAQHHVWVTRFRDGEFFASGKYTNQSSVEVLLFLGPAPSLSVLSPSEREHSRCGLSSGADGNGRATVRRRQGRRRQTGEHRRRRHCGLAHVRPDA